jgi:hypothetical protein
MEWSTLFGNIVSGIVIAVISARLTVHFALKRFYSEKWWERKTEAYIAIIEALHHVRNHADTNLTFSMRNRELPEQGEKRLTEQLEGAMAELRKRADIGSFIISEEAVSALGAFMNELDGSAKTADWVEHLELKLTAVDKCLDTMRRIAKSDLRLK